MRKLRNYFLTEYLYSFLISLGIFTLAFSIGNIVKIVDLIITKGIEPTMVFKLFMTMLPFSLVYTIPISTLISALLTFGKASADNEIIALQTVKKDDVISETLYECPRFQIGSGIFLADVEYHFSGFIMGIG